MMAAASPPISMKRCSPASGRAEPGPASGLGLSIAEAVVGPPRRPSHPARGRRPRP